VAGESLLALYDLYKPPILHNYSKTNFNEIPSESKRFKNKIDDFKIKNEKFTYVHLN